MKEPILGLVAAGSLVLTAILASPVASATGSTRFSDFTPSAGLGQSPGR